MVDGFTKARDSLQANATIDEASRSAKEAASLKGFRDTLTRWLDGPSLQTYFGLDSTGQLFTDKRHLLHSTSAIRYPTFVDGVRYGG